MEPHEPELVTGAELQGVLSELIEREPIFSREEPGRTREDFEAMTASEFWEVGASDRRYSRRFVIETLVERYSKPYRPVWEARDFQLLEPAADVFLLTYTLAQGEKKDRITRRATIWRRSDDKWKIVYHQGTIVEPTVER